MMEYEVIHMISQPEALAVRLNEMASKGWRVVTVVSPYDYIILERASAAYPESLTAKLIPEMTIEEVKTKTKKAKKED